MSTPRRPAPRSMDTEIMATSRRGFSAHWSLTRPPSRRLLLAREPAAAARVAPALARIALRDLDAAHDGHAGDPQRGRVGVGRPRP